MSVCDDCEKADYWECYFCCAKCYEDYGECPNPNCDPRDVYEKKMKLGPCPFCGADVTKIADVPLVDESFVISDDFSFCPSCGCEIKGEENERENY